MHLTKEQFLGSVDHSLLKPNLTLDEVRRGCEFAAEAGVKAVCISPHRLGIAREILSGTPVIIGTVAAFPSGAHMTEVKAFEARACVDAGATEVDMVIDIGALVSGYDDMVRDDIRAVVEAAAPAHVKVILEVHYLTDEQIVRGAQLVSEAGAAFAKTATGFTPSGATPHNVALLRQGAAPETQVKAAGGISTLADVIAVMEAGATRVGISRTKAILDEIEAQG